VDKPHRLIGPARDHSSLLAELQPELNKKMWGDVAKPRRFVGLAKVTTLSLLADFNQTATGRRLMARRH